jgi:hypothetical protein
MKTFLLTLGFIIGYTLIMGFYLILFSINQKGGK